MPAKELSQQTVAAFASGLSRGILRHLHFDRLALVPNLLDENTDPFAQLNLEHGAAGVFMGD